MSVELLRANVEREKKLIFEIKGLLEQLGISPDYRERNNLQNAIFARENQIKILNYSIVLLVNNISAVQKLPETEIGGVSGRGEKAKKAELISVSYELGGVSEKVGISKLDRQNYLRQLHISESSLKEIGRDRKKLEEEFKHEYKQASGYVKTSNKMFLNLSTRLISQGYFRRLGESLKKAGFVFLLESYVSTIFFTTFLSFFLGLVFSIFFFLFSIDLVAPFISIVDFSEVNFLIRLLEVIWIIPTIMIMTFLVLVYYPATEQSSVGQKIDYELPFATIQMAAIAGANIEPSNIFRIIALGKEYPHIKREAKKLMNQINLYGYDLVTALKNVAYASPSKQWADLLNGLSTTIKSGGDLSRLLSKKAETLLFEYRIQREKATKSAETFMDIYISVVIAAPMLMMLLLIMMSVSGIGFSFSVGVITLIIVSIVALVNFLFLGFLHINQKNF